MARKGQDKTRKLVQICLLLPLLIILNNGNLNSAQANGFSSSGSSTSPPSAIQQQQQSQQQQQQQQLQLAATSNSLSNINNLQAQASQNANNNNLVALSTINQSSNNKSASTINANIASSGATSLQQPTAPVKTPLNLAQISGQPDAGPTFSSMQNTRLHNHHHAHNQQQQQQIQLPNITIYISRNEIRKLLGIDTEIYYIQQGHVKPYPLAFAIPLGYNQSDIIFTWQNMGPTNVNYSISLSIGNVEAVETPLINITRSGLMPRNEQVFKITLPCSGKLSAEVDVQVLIQLSCLQPDLTSNSNILQEQSQADNSLASQEQPTTFRTFSHTLAVRRKKICTQQAASSAAAATATTAAAAPSSSMPAISSARPSATLSATQANKLQSQFSRPQANPNLGPAQIQNGPTANGPPMPRFFNRPGANYQDQDQDSSNLNQNLNLNQVASRYPDESSSYLYQQQYQQQQQQRIATKDILSSSAASSTPSIFGPSSASDLNDPPANLVKTMSHPMPPMAPIPIDNPLNKWVKPPQNPEQLQPQLQATTNSQLATSGSLFMIAICFFIIFALIVILLLASSSQSSSSAVGAASGIAAGFSRQSSLKKYPLNSIGKLASIKSWLTRRNSHSASSSSRSSSSMSTGNHGGLGSFGATFGIISAGTLRDAHNNQHLHQQHSMRLNKSSNVLFGSNGAGAAAFNLGHSTNKLSESGLTGNSTTLIRGLNHNANVYPTSGKQQQHNSASADNNNNQTSFHCSYYGTNSIYSHPPTADLLGTGYQASSNNIANYQQQQNQAPTSFHQPGNMYYPITTTNNGLTTRLVWQQANERQQQQQLNSNEAGYFMPLSQTGLSETGSLYQTID